MKFAGYWVMCCLFASFLSAQQTNTTVGIVERLGQTIPMNEEFYDENGNLVLLKSVINKPTILMFVYYKCPGICSPLLTEMTKIVDKMDLELGKDYQIVTMSFDHQEKPDLSRDKRDNYLAELKKKVNPDGWRFFTGDSESIHTVTSGAGFYFKKEGETWLHAGALIAISPEGKITRYLYGIKHLPFDVKMAVYEASLGRTGPTIAKVMQFCFTYDPEGKRYAFDIVRVSGLVTVGLVGLFVVIFLVRPRKKKLM
jgi:protein SCO1/2